MNKEEWKEILPAMVVILLCLLFIVVFSNWSPLDLFEGSNNTSVVNSPPEFVIITPSFPVGVQDNVKGVSRLYNNYTDYGLIKEASG